ncbi:hypothetical protein SAMN05192555_10912 [Franzmannia pantelleriensis]|uniref:YfhG lipoprotein n=1 Tax=Franzmannia pantelleriensis TaxID=48727 RepID=A0A1G9Q5M8_9GAMM|nr:hypothetical protein [Halomonas pantelleriensis]SDM06223.1 hypothetical protein SAMN05192555_10912 [Halomonas pantelleriensis]
MNYRILLSLAAATLLAGCETLPGMQQSEPEPEAELPSQCNEPIPTLVESTCLLDAWVAYGLASQRGDREWREAQLEQLQGSTPEQHLQRAVVLAWGSERQWDQAASMLEEDLHAAPSDLQPLLRYWLNDVEGRRSLANRLERSESQRRSLAEENQSLAEKLEALTDIEQSINLRQYSP